MRSRPVKPRATLTADMHASVPLETRRMRWHEGTRWRMASARRTSRSVGAPYDVPWAAAFWMASTTLGWAWPRIDAPHDWT